MTQQPEALRLADALEKMPGYDLNKVYCEAVFQLRYLQRQFEFLHAENEALKSRALSMRDALETAETVFRSYHKHHKQKGDDVKAQANLDLAEQMAAA